MLSLLYLYRNLARNPLRTTLTLAAVALPITIYVLSMSVVDGVERFLDNSAKQLRLAVTQKSSIINPLPAGHRAKIESLDPQRKDIVAVCSLRWLGGKVDRDPRPLSTIAADADTFLATFPEYNFTQAEKDAWNRDRQAIVVGSGTAGQFGWKVGDRITITPSVPPYTPMEFHIISTAEGATDPVSLWFRRDYVEQELKRIGHDEGWVSFLFVKCASQEALLKYRAAIDETFARSPYETKTQDEKTFMNEFITQQFDLPRNLTILGGVTVFVAIMAAANTMSMNFRDRMNEIATLKAMGFGSPFVFSLIQSESLFLCGVGGFLGAAAPFVAFTWTPMRDMTVPLIQHLQIHPWVCAQAFGIALVIGILAGVWPSWLAVRMRVVQALRNLE